MTYVGTIEFTVGVYRDQDALQVLEQLADKVRHVSTIVNGGSTQHHTISRLAIATAPEGTPHCTEYSKDFETGHSWHPYPGEERLWYCSRCRLQTTRYRSG